MINKNKRLPNLCFVLHIFPSNFHHNQSMALTNIENKPICELSLPPAPVVFEKYKTN